MMFADDLKHHTLLTHDQEIALARRIQCGDDDALDELVQHNLRLVYKIARRYYTNDPATEFDDLIQQGMIGLLTAARRYDPDRDTRFSTFAFFWIRQAVNRATLTAGTIKRDPNTTARQPAVKPATIRARAIRQAPIVRLDAPLRDRRGDDMDNTLIDILADDSLSVEDQVLSEIEAERIFAALKLDKRGQAIVRDWLSGLSRTEVQDKHGVSRSWMYTTLHNRNKEKIMPRTQPTTCMVPGCDQPLYVSKGGTTFPRCHEHQKELWREASKAQRDAAHDPHPQKPPLPKPHVPPVGALRDAPSVPPRYEVERGLVGEDEQPHDCTCPDCIYREIVSLLAARNPRIAELVEVMQTARRLRDDLGI